MRQFTNSNSFHDNDGNLLVGRITFYKKGTTEKQNITNESGAVLANPIYTNNIGQTNFQVFLEDKDYTISFEKYIGNGNMETDTDTSHWLHQYSCVNLYDTFTIKVDSKGLQVINTIADLRNTDPTIIAEQSGNKIIQLAGYYNAGDKPTILYVWNEDSTDDDDGGGVIKVNDISLGRWELVSNQTNLYDVRHWGAFPKISYTDLEDTQAYAIQSAYNYAARQNDEIFFPSANIGPGYYRIQSNLSNCVFDKNTYVFIPNNYNVTLKLSNNSMNFMLGQSPDYIGSITVEGTHLHNDCIKTFDSQSVKYDKVNLKASERFDLDCNLYENKTLENIEVYIKSGVKSNVANKILTLNNCEIHSIKAIHKDLHVNFTQCEIRENMFADDNLLANCNFTQCISRKSFWTTVRKYINYWSKNGETMLDLENDTINVTFTLPRNALIKNANTTTNAYINLQESAVTDVKIVDSNVRLTFASASSKNIKLTFINSTIDLTGANFSDLICTNSTFAWTTTVNNPSITNADIQNSVINFNGTQKDVAILSFTNTVGIENSWINVPISVTEATTAIIRGCTINKAIATTNISLYNNEINATIHTYDKNGIIDFYVEGNKFRNGYHMLYANTPNTVVNGKWINNSSEMPQHFIGIDRTNLNPSEPAHGYTYAGNSGKAVLQKYGSSEVSITIYPNSATAPNVGLKAYILSGVQIAIWMYGHPVKIAFFSVGTKNIDKICDWSMSPDEYIPGVKYYSGVNKGGIDRIFDTNVWAPNYAFPTKTKSLTDIEYSSDNFKNLEFEGGYTWGITFGKPYTQGSVFYCSGDIDGSSPFDYEDKDWWTGLTSATRKVTIYARVRDVYENQGY